MRVISRMKTSLHSCPKGLLALLVTEIPELFGRYGIMTTLALYLTKNLHQSDASAVLVFSTYLMLAAITPLLGGALADRVLGYKRAIVVGAVVMLVGDLLMAVPSELMLYVGLGILVSGTGLFSPSLAALVSHLYRDKDQQRDKAFVAYYVAKNIGALLAPPLCGVVGVFFGYHYCFLVVALGLLAGLLVYCRNYHHIPDVSIVELKQPRDSFYYRALRYFQSKPVSGVIALLSLVSCLSSLVFVYHARELLLVFSVVIVVGVFVSLFLNSSDGDKKKLAVIVLAILSVITFFAMNHLCGASFNLFVERVINRQYLGMEIPTSVFYAIDPLFMILFGAVIARCLARIQKPNYIVASFSKFTLALLIFSLAMLVFTFAAYLGTQYGSASGLTVVICYSLCATSELCIVPIALSLVTKLSPTGKTGLMVGLYGFSDAIASFFTGVIATSGVVNFTVHSLHGREMAAKIYLQLFAHLSVALLVSAVVVMLIRYVLSRRQEWVVMS